jgi:hypothetical protein
MREQEKPRAMKLHDSRRDKRNHKKRKMGAEDPLAALFEVKVSKKKRKEVAAETQEPLKGGSDEEDDEAAEEGAESAGEGAEEVEVAAEEEYAADELEIPECPTVDDRGNIMSKKEQRRWKKDFVAERKHAAAEQRRKAAIEGWAAGKTCAVPAAIAPGKSRIEVYVPAMKDWFRGRIMVLDGAVATVAFDDGDEDEFPLNKPPGPYRML